MQHQDEVELGDRHPRPNGHYRLWILLASISIGYVGFLSWQVYQQHAWTVGMDARINGNERWMANNETKGANLETRVQRCERHMARETHRAEPIR